MANDYTWPRFIRKNEDMSLSGKAIAALVLLHKTFLYSLHRLCAASMTLCNSVQFETRTMSSRHFFIGKVTLCTSSYHTISCNFISLAPIPNPQAIDIAREQDQNPLIAAVKQLLSRPDSVVNADFLEKATNLVSMCTLDYRNRLVTIPLLAQHQPCLVVPNHLQNVVVEAFHSNSMPGGHYGYHKTLHKLRQKNYWDNMPAFVSHAVLTCGSCQSRNKPLPARNQLLDPAPSTKAPHSVGLDTPVSLPDSPSENNIPGTFNSASMLPNGHFNLQLLATLRDTRSSSSDTAIIAIIEAIRTFWIRIARTLAMERTFCHFGWNPC